MHFIDGIVDTPVYVKADHKLVNCIENLFQCSESISYELDWDNLVNATSSDDMKSLIFLRVTTASPPT